MKKFNLRSTLQCSTALALLVMVMTTVMTTVMDAQQVHSVWKSTLPANVSHVSAAFDCTRYAYVIGDSLVVRGDATDGRVIDTIRASKISSMVYCKQRIFILRNPSKDTAHIECIDDASERFVSTGVDFVNSDSMVFNSVTLHSPASQEVFACHVTFVNPKLPPLLSIQFGEYRVYDRTDLYLRTRISSVPYPMHSSADGKFFILQTLFSEADASNTYEWTVFSPEFVGLSYDVPKNLDYHPYLFPIPVGIDGIVCSGITVFDTKRMRQLRQFTEGVAPICNLDTAGWMLCYDMMQQALVITNVKDMLSTNIEKCWIERPENVFTMANSSLGTVIVADAKSRFIGRYRYSELPSKEANKLVVSRFKTPMNPECVVRIADFERLPISKCAWFVDDVLVGSQKSYQLTFVTDLLGTHDVQVIMYDVNDSEIGRLSTKLPAYWTKPQHVSSLYQMRFEPPQSLAFSSSGQYLAAGLRSRTVIGEPPPKGDDEGFSVVRSAPMQQATAFLTDNDYIGQVTLWEVPDAVMHWSRHSLSSGDSVPLGFVRATMRSSRLPFHSSLTLNKATGRCFSYSPLTFRGSSGIGGLVEACTDHNRVLVPLESPVIDVDASYRNYLLATTGTSISIYRLGSTDELQVVPLPGINNLRAILMVRSDLIVTSTGVLKYDGSWNWKSRFDTVWNAIDVVRLPNTRYVFILRSHDSTAGHVIDVETGEVVQTLKTAFAGSTCCAYDPQRRELAIGDYFGIVSWYAIDEEYTRPTSQDEPVPEVTGAIPTQEDIVYPNPTSDAFQLGGIAFEEMTNPEVTAINQLGETFRLVSHDGKLYSVAMLPTGPYILHITDGSVHRWAKIVRE